MWFVFSVLVQPAPAAELQLQRQGAYRLEAFVDGEHVGRVKGARKALVVDLEPGMHEVWLTRGVSNDVVRCYGLVDGSAPATIALTNVHDEDAVCPGLEPGIGPTGATASRGAMLEVYMEEITKWVSVDGGRMLTLPAGVYRLNLAPGAHHVSIYDDPLGSSLNTSRKISLEPGKLLKVGCGKGKCVGFRGEQRSLGR